MKIALIGYSGHAYVVADILIGNGYEIAGYFEQNEKAKNPFLLKFLGNERSSDLELYKKDVLMFPAIGDNNSRRDCFEFLSSKGCSFVSALSQRAYISSSVRIGTATMICQGASVNPFAEIGKCAIINTSAVIEHECIIGDYSHIAPGAVLSGNVKVGAGSFIGANCVIKQGITIGSNVIIGAGAVVIKDIADNEIHFGNPAKKYHT